MSREVFIGALNYNGRYVVSENKYRGINLLIDFYNFARFIDDFPIACGILSALNFPDDEFPSHLTGEDVVGDIDPDLEFFWVSKCYDHFNHISPPGFYFGSSPEKRSHIGFFRK